MNRRDLLLGTLGFGALNLSGCICLGACNTSGIRHTSVWQRARLEQCENVTPRNIYLKWYVEKDLSIMLIDGEKIDDGDNEWVETGNFVFISDNFPQPNFTQLPISLLNKGYLNYFILPNLVNDKSFVDDNVCKKPINLAVYRDVYVSLLFSHQDLTKQEIELLKRTFGNNLSCADYGALKNPNKFGEYKYYWRKGDFTGEPFNRDSYITEKHHLFGQKVYRIETSFKISKLYTHSFESFFDVDKGMAYELSQTGEMFEKKATWAKKNLVPSSLLTVENGQLLYQGRILNNRFDKVARLNREGRLIKSFGG